MLRIKVMQNLFAYQQCMDANYELAVDYIEAYFQPDLNSMEAQDKELLARQRKSARQLFEKKFKKPATPDSPEDIINKVVANAFAQLEKAGKKDEVFLLKNMVAEVEKLTGTYHAILGLVSAFAELAQADKKIKHDRFRENPWVKAIRNHAELNKELLKGNIGWHTRTDKVRGWFRDVIKADDAYIDYISSKKQDTESDKVFIKHLIRKLILTGTINDYFEEDDIRWAEDREIVKGLLDKTIKSFNESSGQLELQKLSLDWDDDKNFISTLFEKSVHLPEEHKQLVAANTRNWEVDRLPLTDRVILEMAIAELIHFPNIPVKVSINEYIELTKEYSTPKSKQFINGILDVIAKELQKRGAVKKSGRGLIDNK
jgi:N utilization substance protein B